MSEQEQPVEGTEPNPQTPENENTPPPENEQRVPYDRFKQVNDEKTALAAKLAEFEERERERAQAELSEIERAQQQAAEAQARAEAAEQKALTLERSGWVVAAARDAGFADPSDAALAVDLAGVEDPAAAKAAVESLAKDKPHWLSQAKPTGFGHIGDRQRREPEIPVGPDGKPDVKAGLGAELAKNLLG